MNYIKLNNILKKCFLLILPVTAFFSFSFWTNDVMYEVFQPSRNNIIYIWSDVSTVWRTVLRQRITGSVWLQWYTAQMQEPLIVRIVKFILKMTVVLSVTMVIFYSTKFMVEVFKWNDLKSASAKKDIINLIIWLLIALFSITAVELMISIPKSSLRTSGDITYNDNISLNTQNI